MPKSLMGYLAILLALFTSAVACAESFEVRMREGASATEITAVGELQDILSKRCAAIQMVEGAVIIHVGDTALAREKGIDARKLEEEQWVIRSFGRDVVLVGGGTRGTLYAVYHFLEDVCGVRFWCDHETDIPHSDVLKLKPLFLTGKPAFTYRDIHRSTVAEDSTARFAVRRRLNRNGDVPIGEALGGGFTYGPPYHCHTFDLYVPWSKYGKEHPEYFSLVNGKRVGGQTEGQLCLSNPDVRRLLREGLWQSIAQGDAAAKQNGVPAPRLYELSMNDNTNACECGACKDACAKYGASGFYLNFINELADEVAAKHPEIFISMLLYHYTEPPPKGGVKPRDNVVAKLCDTRSNQALSLADECNGEFRTFLESWGRIAKHLLIWDYAVVYVNPSAFFPFASEFTLAETYRQFRKNHVMGVFLEHEHRDVADMYVLKYYLESKVMENPDVDMDDLIRRTLNEYFGAAGAFIYRARRHLYDVTRAKKGVVTWFPQPTAFDFITRADLDEMAALWDAAERAVKDNAKYLARVRHARNSQDALWAFRHQAPTYRDGVFAWGAEAFLPKEGTPYSLVADEGGTVLKIDLDKICCDQFDPPFGFGIFDYPKGKTVSEGVFPKPKDGHYTWFEKGGIALPTHHNHYFYLGNTWGPQFRMYHPELTGKKVTLRVKWRGEGPKFRVSDTRRNALYIARVEMIPEICPN